MAVPDLSELTRAELQEWITALNQRYVELDAAEKATADARRSAISDAIAHIETILGPADAAPGVGSIRAVRAFDAVDLAAGQPRGTTMAANAPLALSLLFEGMELVTANALNVAYVIKNAL